MTNEFVVSYDITEVPATLYFGIEEHVDKFPGNVEGPRDSWSPPEFTSERYITDAWLEIGDFEIIFDDTEIQELNEVLWEWLDEI